MAPGGPLSFASAASAPAKAASAGIASGTAPGATSGTAPEKGAGPSSGNDSEPETWPELWQRLFQKASPAPLLWSYRELASDLLHPDQSSSARSAVLRALIKALALPAGTSTFWPLQLDASELPPSEQAQGLPFCCSNFFLSGLSRLQPKIVIIFGDQESDSGPPPYTSDILGGRAYVYLPPLAQFSQSQEAMGKAVNVLRSMVMQFSILSTP